MKSAMGISCMSLTPRYRSISRRYESCESADDASSDPQNAVRMVAMAVPSVKPSSLPNLICGSLRLFSSSTRHRPKMCIRDSLRTEHLTETADNTHHVRGSDDDVEVEPVFLLDLLDEVHLADIVSAGSLGSLSLVALGEDENADVLAGAVGEDDGAADLLVSVTGVDAQLDVQLDGLVELRGSGLADQAEALCLSLIHILHAHILCQQMFYSIRQPKRKSPCRETRAF